nr:MAG TPA: hypothetical protein [Caudoviricetes sp.]
MGSPNKDIIDQKKTKSNERRCAPRLKIKTIG